MTLSLKFGRFPLYSNKIEHFSKVSAFEGKPINFKRNCHFEVRYGIFFWNKLYQPPKKLHKIPAAIAEPITPDMFGAMACIRRKFVGSSFWPTI